MYKDIFLVVMFLFIFGACNGWLIEVIFRKFFSNTNPEHKWLNPGLTTGPWLPIYGFGTVFLFFETYLQSELNLNPIIFNIVLFFGSATIMTLMELIGGLILLKFFHLRLWDYRDCKWNYKGVICPLFYFIWGAVSFIYYYLLSDFVIDVVIRYFAHLDIFTFFVGFLWGIFTLDVWNAFGITNAVKKFAKENHIVVHFETVKQESKRLKKSITNTKHNYFFTRIDPLKLVEVIKKHNEELQLNFVDKARAEIAPLIERIEERKEKVTNKIKDRKL